MLKLTLFEVMFRTIPEAFIFIFACYAFSRTKIDRDRYIVSSILFAVTIYFIRLLPINYGIHTILDIVIMNALMYMINRVNIILSIKSSIIATIILLFLEGLNMLILSFILKEQLEVIMLNPYLKVMYGLPSIMCFATIVLFYYYYINKKEQFKYDKN